MREGGKSLRFEVHEGLQQYKVYEIRSAMQSWFAVAELTREASGILVLLIEEICTNIMEHSDATWIELGLGWFKDGTLITVDDNGKEFDPTRSLSESDFVDNLDGIADRRLGLMMVRELCKKFVYFRHPKGINQIVMEVPDKEYRQKK